MGEGASARKSSLYNKAAGLPRGVATRLDFYRYSRVRGCLCGGSVCDVGPGRADFLDLIRHGYHITGVDMNQECVEHCNAILEEDAVKLGDIDNRLPFDDNSFDTVTCLEVFEHLQDPEQALKELVRVSRKRVIITVPCNETIQHVLCIHCAKYTPSTGRT